MDCQVQIFVDDSWKIAAVFEPDPQTIDKGIAGGGRLQYDIDYAVTYLGNIAAELIPGLTVGFELFRFEHWPPFLDPVGIVRVSRWEDERPGNQPEWANICEKLKDLIAPIETTAWLADLGEDVKRLAETMKDCHVDDDIIQRLAGWIDEVAAGLVEIRPRTWI